MALAFVPSSLMLGATGAMTTNLAPIPLLWVLPLSLYLVSFILVFSRGEGAGPFHKIALYAMPPLAVLLAGVVTIGFYEPLWLIIGVHLVTFFAVALAMHGELAADRPAASQLTQFFAWVSVGGALGGVFNVIVAPLAFNSLTEYPIVLILACFLLPMRAGSWTEEISVRRHLLAPVALGAAGLALLVFTEDAQWPRRLVLVGLGVACVTMFRNPLRFGLAVALAMVAVWVPALDESDVIFQDRSFFGVNRVEVTPDGIINELRNGNIVHGNQVGGVALEPSTYYHRTGPMGQLLDALPDRSNLSEAAVVGLGAGTMACLSEPGENWTFFEIDPTVVRIARTPDLFSYLRDCKGNFEVQVGDGRLLLEGQPRAPLRPDRSRRLQLRRDPDPPAHPRGDRDVRGQAAPGRGARLPRVEQVPGPGARARQRGARRGARVLRPGRQGREPPLAREVPLALGDDGAGAHGPRPRAERQALAPLRERRRRPRLDRRLRQRRRRIRLSAHWTHGGRRALGLRICASDPIRERGQKHGEKANPP